MLVDKKKLLEKQEKELKNELKANIFQIKIQIKRILKVALVTGLVSLIGYQVIKLFFFNSNKIKQSEKPLPKRPFLSKGIMKKMAYLLFIILTDRSDIFLKNRKKKNQQ